MAQWREVNYGRVNARNNFKGGINVGQNDFSLKDDESTDEECSNCNKKFRVRCVISADHECYPIDEGEKE